MARVDARGIITELRERSGISPTSLRARSDVSRATQRRIDTGESDVTLGTLRELAIAAGLDIALDLVPLSDPEAAAGARALLDETVKPDTVSPAAAAWLESLLRLTADPLRQSNSPLEIVTDAISVSANRRLEFNTYLGELFAEHDATNLMRFIIGSRPGE